MYFGPDTETFISLYWGAARNQTVNRKLCLASELLSAPLKCTRVERLGTYIHCDKAKSKEGWGGSSCWSFSIGAASLRCIAWPPPSTGCLTVGQSNILNDASREHPTLILIHGLEYQRRKMLHTVRWRHFISAKRIANGRYFDNRAADILAFN